MVDENLEKAMDSLIECIQNHNDNLQNVRGNKIELPSPEEYFIQNEMVASIYEKIMQSNQTGVYPVLVGCSFKATPCIKPIDKLIKISITQLQIEKKAMCKFICVRVIKPGYEVMFWNSVVEDDFGSVCALIVLNYPSEQLFPVGTILLIKEPYLKIGMENIPYIRVDCPTDIVVVTRDHPLFDGVDTINWAFKFSDIENEQSMRSCKNWFLRGTYLLKNQEIFRAREALSVAIQMANFFTEPDLIRSCQYQLTVVYFALGHYEKVIELAEQLMQFFKMEEFHIAVLIGRAYYELRKYHPALIWFQRYGTANPDNEWCQKEIRKIRRRIQQQFKGDISFDNLQSATLNFPYTKLDCASYFGNVRVFKSSSSAKKKMLVAAKNIASGTCILVSKAIAAIVDPKKTLGFFCDDDNVVFNNRSHQMLVSELAQLLFKNPKTYSKLIFRYPPGPKKKKVRLYCNDLQLEPVVDIDVIKSICRYNALDIYVNYDREHLDQNETIGCGLFPLPARMNHSCVPNTSCQFYNDVMVLLAVKDILKGEELFLSYIPLGQPIAFRKTMLNNRGIICQCELCESEQIAEL
ncbi:hypothetical protein CHUAL_006438 [Chamberlinius hualienensis]